MSKRKLYGLKQMIIGIGVGLVIGGMVVEQFVFDNTVPIALFLTLTGLLCIFGINLTLPKENFKEEDERL